MNYPATGANRELSQMQYGLRASFYDYELTAFDSIRRNAIDRLQLEPGDTVLDVGCGTGLSFEHLESAVGRSGKIFGIEQCKEMLDVARAKEASHGWTNVTLINMAAELTRIAFRGDAALFHFTHDILRNPDAIENVVQCLRPGAHVVAVGLQWSYPWALATNWWVLQAALYSVTTLEGLHQPWDLLAMHMEQIEVSTTLFGGVFIASGVLKH